MNRFLGVAAAAGGVAGYALAGDYGLWTPVALIVAAGVLVTDAVAAARASGRTSDARAVTPVDGWDELDRELARARRHARPFALIRLPGAGRQLAVLERLRPLQRRTDRAWLDGGDAFIVLPEADDATVGGLVGRIEKEQPSFVSEAPHFAVFPRDGLTSGALLAAVYGQPLPSVVTPHLAEPTPLVVPATLIALPTGEDQPARVVGEASG